MSGLSGRTGRLLVVVLLLLATAAFGIGVAIEKSEEGDHAEPAAAAHDEAGEDAGAASAEATPAEEDEEETIFGIEAESTPLVIVGLVLSLVVAGAVWLFGRWRWMLAVSALFCLAFAILDGIEASRKWGDETTIAALAIAALILHAGAALVAGLLVHGAEGAGAQPSLRRTQSGSV